MVDVSDETDSSSRDAGSKSVDIREEPVRPRSITTDEKVSEGNGLSSKVSIASGKNIQLSSLKDFDLNWNPEGWREFLGFPDEEDFLSRIRGNTFSGKPLFAENLVADLEKERGVSLTRRPIGRPKKS
jgi:putative transposase